MIQNLFNNTINNHQKYIKFIVNYMFLYYFIELLKKNQTNYYKKNLFYN